MQDFFFFEVLKKKELSCLLILSPGGFRIEAAGSHCTIIWRQPRRDKSLKVEEGLGTVMLLKYLNQDKPI